MELDGDKRTMENHDEEVSLLTLERWRRTIKKNHYRQIAIEATEAQAVMNKIGQAQEEQEMTLKNLTGTASAAAAKKFLRPPAPAPQEQEVPGPSKRTTWGRKGTSSTSSAPSSSSDYSWIGVDSLTGSRQQETGRPGSQPSPCPQRLPKGFPTPVTRKLSPGFSKSRAAAEAKSVDSDTSEELHEDKSGCKHEWTGKGTNRFCDMRTCRLCNLRIQISKNNEMVKASFIDPQALQEARVAKKEHKNLVNQKVSKIAARLQKDLPSK